MLIKILVVSDTASDGFYIKNALSEYSVLTACDGMEAMYVLEAQDGINLLILDLSIPDGLQILEALKENERFARLRIIVLTNHDEADNEIKALSLGAADYIRKPIHMVSLKARIDIHASLLRAEQVAEHHLDVQTHFFDIIFNQAPIGIAISYNPHENPSDESIVKINPIYEKITGRTREELLSLGWGAITHPDDLEEDMNNYRKLQSGEIKIYSMDKRYIKPDGSVVWAHIIVAPLIQSNSHQISNICLAQDITERKAVEKALHESERSKSVVLSHLPGLAYRCNYDSEWTMQYVSKGCFYLTGYAPESLLYNRDLSYNDLISPEYRETLFNEWVRILSNKLPFKHEYEIITAAGERKWVLELGQGIYNDKNEVEALEGIVIDISDRKAIENALKYNNEHDRWTGLHNRDYMVSLLQRDIKLKDKSKKALIGINLSMVQLVAANYWFQYSQNLIKKASEALRLYCTNTRLLFHPRENRFVFYIFDYKDKGELLDFSYTIAEALETIFVTEKIGGGIGILEIEQSSSIVDVDLLLRRLLIVSERSVSFFGKDFEVCFYDEKLEDLINRERDIVEILDIIAADKQTNNSLFLQYQPIIDLKSGVISGFEALARLRTEKLGPVSPVEFIPIAEKTKLILPIGEKVIITAFRFLNKLKEHGYNNIDISINISVIQLLHPNFTSRLFELIEHMQVNPKNVGIEITESVFTSDYECINNVIRKLRCAGLHVAIDDFGTGYSSLAREKELVVDYLKIDKYFIDKLIGSELNKAITSDIISMSHKLGHSTIAEGVEHEIQMQYLKEHGCDRVQGYLISRPLNEEDTLEFLKKQEQSLLALK